MSEPDNTLIIRIATLTDVAAMAQLVSDSARRFITPEFPPEGVCTMLNSLVPQAFMENFEAGFRYWVAEIGGVLAGVVGLRPPTHLFHLFVTSSHQRQGIGKKLWHTLRDDIYQNQSEMPAITVNASRHAIPFYQNEGFIFINAQSPSRTYSGVISFPMIFFPRKLSPNASN